METVHGNFYLILVKLWLVKVCCLAIEHNGVLNSVTLNIQNTLSFFMVSIPFPSKSLKDNTSEIIFTLFPID